MMTPNDENIPAGKGPEAGATPEAVAMHGEQARAEKYDQPDAVTLDTDTRISTPDEDADSEAGATLDTEGRRAQR